MNLLKSFFPRKQLCTYKHLNSTLSCHCNTVKKNKDNGYCFKVKPTYKECQEDCKLNADFSNPNENRVSPFLKSVFAQLHAKPLSLTRLHVDLLKLTSSEVDQLVRIFFQISNVHLCISKPDTFVGNLSKFSVAWQCVTIYGFFF